MEKLIFDISKEDNRECGTIVRVKASAAMAITRVMRETGMNASEIATRMILYAAENYEVRR